MAAKRAEGMTKLRSASSKAIRALFPTSSNKLLPNHHHHIQNDAFIQGKHSFSLSSSEERVTTMRKKLEMSI